jgi:phospholipid/cholesterol/gamma-HCH transport system substrate-binding protein
MNERNMQIKVGALILVALGLLVGFVLLLGSFSVGAVRSYFIEVADSGSVLRGAPVKIAGVRAGRVEDVEFLVARNARKSAAESEGELPINVRLRITVAENMAAAVRRDSEFYITTQGVLGEKYVEIVPGTEASPEWADGAYIRGRDPARIDLLFAKAGSILAKVEAAFAGSEGLNLGELARSLIKLVKNVDEILTDNKTRLTSIATNVEQATGDAAGLAKYLREGVGSSENVGAIVQNVKSLSATAATEAKPLIATAQRTMKNVDESVVVLKDVVEKNRGHIDVALANLEPISQHARTVMRDAAALTAGVSTGRGTIGQLIIDQEIYDDLKEMLRDLKRHPWKMLWRE